MKKAVRVIFIPNYMIETEEARQLLPAWLTERAVFYNYGTDWFYLFYEPHKWLRHFWLQRN